MFIVRRSANAITVLLPEGVLSNTVGRWSFRPYQYAVMRKLKQIYGRDAEWDRIRLVMRAVLRGAVQILADLGHGGYLCRVDRE